MTRDAILACWPWLATLIVLVVGLCLTVRLNQTRLEWRRLILLHADQGGGSQTLSFVLTLPLFIMIDHIGAAIFMNEIFVQDIFHIPGKEERVVQIVEFGVYNCIFDSIRHVFDADYFPALVCHEVGNGSGSGVKVIYQLIPGKSGKVTRYFI